MSTGKIRPMTATIAAVVALSLAGGCVSAVEGNSMTAEIWADNWFEMFVDGQKVLEDLRPSPPNDRSTPKASSCPCRCQ